MLTLKQKAPHFSLPDQDGKIHNLSDYLGKKASFIFIRKTIHQDVQLRRVISGTTSKRLKMQDSSSLE